MGYLADKFSKNGKFYPQNEIARALVNQEHYFDASILSKAISAYYYPITFQGARVFEPAKLAKLKEAFKILNEYLEGHDYIVGRTLTIADLAITATVTTCEAFGFDISKYENVSKWLKKIKTSCPGYRKANIEGVELLRKYFRRKLREIGIITDDIG